MAAAARNLILYGVRGSPPCCSVIFTAKTIGVNLQVKLINMLKEKHKSTEYLKINPAHTVPTLDDNGFYLNESHAIITYLVSKYAKDDKLYPKDIQQRAIVDSMMYFNSYALLPAILNYYRSMLLFLPDVHEKHHLMNDRLHIIDAFLQMRGRFAAGNHITVADICICSSLSVPEAVDASYGQPFASISSYMEAVKEAMDPLFSEEHFQNVAYYVAAAKQAEEKRLFARKAVASLSIPEKETN